MSQLSSTQTDALQALGGHRNLFITGAPGTGKSFLIRHFLANHPEKVPVLASTGAAAILVGGRTFHSFFGLGIMQGGALRTFEKAMKNKRLRSRLRKAHTLIIDEVSMLSSECFDCAEAIARAHRVGDEPWGGIRIVAVGDFAQLPPVSRDSSRPPWAFHGQAWMRSNFQTFNLREVHRTADKDFLRILEKIRWAEIDIEVQDFLNAKQNIDSDLDVPHIFPRRYQTEAFNTSRLHELETELHSVPTKYSGDERYIQTLKRDAPVPEVLQLKQDALVMIRINDPKQRFVNGSLARVREVNKDSLLVEMNHRFIELNKFCFSYLNADGEEMAMAENFPVSLAYATTIHKTQGATVDKLHVDLKNLWEPGQAYVAMSRVTSSQGLSVGHWDRSSFKCDDQVRAFYSGLKKSYQSVSGGKTAEAF